tara:strand:+ start:8389 stop:9081 length:693 start_codon:yes stop_codon:yes gene_type:complete
MAFRYSPKIVTDGLIFYIDAGNPKSYVSGSTTWYNLIDTVTTATLINSPSFDSSNAGSIVFDGVNDYIAETTIGINSGQNFTVNIWFYNQEGFRGGLISSGYPYQTNKGWWVFVRQGNQICISVGQDNRYAFTSNDVLVTNKWYNVVVTVSAGGDSFALWLNNTSTTWGTDVSPSPLTIDYSAKQYTMGRLHGGSDYLEGKIATASVYNRILTTAEISQNYNAMKSRFGL